MNTDGMILPLHPKGRDRGWTRTECSALGSVNLLSYQSVLYAESVFIGTPCLRASKCAAGVMCATFCGWWWDLQYQSIYTISLIAAICSSHRVARRLR